MQEEHIKEELRRFFGLSDLNQYLTTTPQRILDFVKTLDRGIDLSNSADLNMVNNILHEKNVSSIEWFSGSEIKIRFEDDCRINLTAPFFDVDEVGFSSLEYGIMTYVNNGRYVLELWVRGNDEDGAINIISDYHPVVHIPFIEKIWKRSLINTINNDYETQE